MHNLSILEVFSVIQREDEKIIVYANYSKNLLLGIRV